MGNDESRNLPVHHADSEVDETCLHEEEDCRDDGHGGRSDLPDKVATPKRQVKKHRKHRRNGKPKKPRGRWRLPRDWQKQCANKQWCDAFLLKVIKEKAENQFFGNRKSPTLGPGWWRKHYNKCRWASNPHNCYNVAQLAERGKIAGLFRFANQPSTPGKARILGAAFVLLCILLFASLLLGYFFVYVYGTRGRRRRRRMVTSSDSKQRSSKTGKSMRKSRPGGKSQAQSLARSSYRSKRCAKRLSRVSRGQSRKSSTRGSAIKNRKSRLKSQANGKSARKSNEV